MRRSISLMLLVAAVAVGASARAGALDALLVRGAANDALVLRPWVDPAAAPGVWIWPVAADTRVVIDDRIGIDALRSAVWMGHQPLSRANADIMTAYCLLSTRQDLTPAETRLLGIFATVEDLDDALDAAGLPPLVGAARARAADTASTGRSLAVVCWRVPAVSKIKHAHDGSMPLEAVVLHVPGHLDELPLGDEDAGRGCIGRLIAVAARPVVPGPADADRWAASLLVGRAAAAPMEVAWQVAPQEVTPDWAVTALDLTRCDGATVLHPMPLPSGEEIPPAAARVAASWYGLRPGTDGAAVLRAALADGCLGLSVTETACLVWAWSRQRSDDVIPVLERWRDHPDALVRCEALLGLVAADSTHARDRDLDALERLVVPHHDALRTIHLVGPRVVANVDQDEADRLRAIADAGAGRYAWRFGERVDALELLRVDAGDRPSASTPFNMLTAGAWAVAALAVVNDGPAITTIREALVESAILAVADLRRPRRGCVTSGGGLSSDFWNGYQIVEPHRSGRAWATLYRFEIALAEWPERRERILRMALRDPRLPVAAATILLASLPTWRSQDEAMAAAILDTARTPRDHEATRFFARGRREGPHEVDVALPRAAAGAAYVLGQRGATTPLLAALARDPDPVLRAELIFALALAPERGAAERDVIAAWLEEIDTEIAAGRATDADIVARARVELALDAFSRSPYATRFATDHRPQTRR